MGDDGRSLVTKTSFRMLQTLYNLGPAPEPNLTIWYSARMPDGFRRFAAKVAIDTSALQFESDEIMRRTWGDDGAIACCVSPMLVGKQMQFFGARANLAKCLLYAINGGRDEMSGKQVGPASEPVKGEYLDFDEVVDRFEKMMDWLAGVYVNAMNVIHYMHDKYAYERIEMALHDYAPVRTMAFGMAGLVGGGRQPLGDQVREGEGGPRRRPAWSPTTRPRASSRSSATTTTAWISSPSWAGQHLHEQAAEAPDLPERAAHAVDSDHHVERRVREGDRETRRMAGGRASRSRPARTRCTGGTATASTRRRRRWPRSRTATRQDGISLTATLVPTGLGRVAEDRITNLTASWTRSSAPPAIHMNVNVLNRDTLIDAMEHPEKYPSLTIRVSGYAVNFVRLTREQQMDVINRTFHGGVDT